MHDILDEYIVATRLIHRPQGASIDELAQALDKTPRAVFSILSQLDDMFPLYTDKDPYNSRKMRYYADSTFAEYLPDLEFTDEDKAVYNYLVSEVENMPDIRKDAKRLFNKLRIMASERGALLEEGFNKSVSIVSRPKVSHKADDKVSSSVKSDLMDAIREGKWINIIFRAVEDGYEAEWKSLYPIEMVMTDGVLNLLALNALGKLWEISVCLIRKVSRKFEAPKPKDLSARKADIKERLEDPFGFECDSEIFTVKAQLSKSVVPYIKARKWPESVTFTDLEDGSAIMEAHTHNTSGFMTWVLMNAPNVKVLEPQWMIGNLIDACQQELEILKDSLKPSEPGKETYLVVRRQKRSPKI